MAKKARDGTPKRPGAKRPAGKQSGAKPSDVKRRRASDVAAEDVPPNTDAAAAASRLDAVRLRLALDAAGMGTWEWWPDSDAVIADRRLFELMGTKQQSPVTGEQLFACAHAEDRDGVREAMAAALASGRVFEHTMRIVRSDSGEIRWMAVRGALVDSGEQARRLIGVTFDITARKEAEEALKSSEERFQLAMGAVDGLVYDWDIRSDTVYRSDGMFDVIGLRPRDAATTRSWWLSRMHPEDRGAVMARLEELLDGVEEYFNVEYRVRHEAGHWVHLWDQGRILRDAEGRPVRVIGSRSDITERKQAEERQALLMAELDHRVKNILANVGAIANRTSQRNTSVKEFIASLEGRIRAMATAHSLLSATRWQGASLYALVEEQLAPFVSPTGDNISFSGPDLIVTPKAAQSLGLALHELVTNAAKHGALSSPDGRVTVAWQVEDSHDPPIARLTWRESGGPQVAPPSAKGFGLTVLQDMVSQDLTAEVECAFDRAGVTCVIAFPGLHLVVAGQDETAAASPPPTAAGTDRPGVKPGAAGKAAQARRVLVVEDAWVVGLQLKTILEVMGHEVVGPATTLDEALALAEMDGLDGAILDIRLDDCEAFPVADRLREREVRFGFATGYSEEYNIPHRFRDAPRVGKPYSDGAIEALLERLFR